GLPCGRRLGRAVLHRWPALAVATVAAAVPASVLAAQQFPDGILAGPSYFQSSNSDIAINAVNNSNYLAPVIKAAGGHTGLDALGQECGVKASSGGVAVAASSYRTAVKASSTSEAGVEASG